MTTHLRNVPSVDPEKLGRLAEIAVKVGLRLQPGQDLFLTAPIAALPLARKIAEEAYKAGAGLVTPVFSDEEMTLARYRFAPDAEFRPRAGLALRRRRQGVRRQYGPARDRRRGSDAACRTRIPRKWRAPTRRIRSPTSRRWRRSPASTSTGTSSPIRACPGRSGCFRATTDEVAVARLADAIFSASRVDGDDPVAAWAAHNAALAVRTRWLNEQALPRPALFRAPART